MEPSVLVSVIFGIVQLLVMASRTETVDVKMEELLHSVKRYR